jgi:hypothetical protein
MDCVDTAKSKLMMIFLLDQGAFILGRYTDLFWDGTFDTCPDPFIQVYFITGQTGPAKKGVHVYYFYSQIKKAKPT